MKKEKFRVFDMLKNESGSALILVMIILVSGVLVFSSIASVSLLQRSASSKARSSTEAIQLADSCVEWSLKQYYESILDDPIDDSGDISGNVFTWDNGLPGSIGVGLESYDMTKCDIYLVDESGVIIDDSRKGDDLSIVSEVRVVANAGFGDDETRRAIQIGLANCGEDVEYEGETYPTVKINDQCWMAKNLNVGDAVCDLTDGDTCPDDMSNDSNIEKYCYENDPDNCDDYGGLYQWDEAMGYVEDEEAQGICPDGWHIPISDDWLDLRNFLDPSNIDLMNNEFLPVHTGVRTPTGGFTAIGPAASFLWTSSVLPLDRASYSLVLIGDPYPSILAYDDVGGIAVRCLKN